MGGTCSSMQSIGKPLRNNECLISKEEGKREAKKQMGISNQQICIRAAKSWIKVAQDKEKLRRLVEAVKDLQDL